MKKKCDVQDCEAECISKNKIYCGSHYMRWWRYGDPLKGKFKKKVLTIGKRNYRSWADVCEAHGCDKKVLPDGCKGYCRTHYARLYKYNDPYYIPEKIEWRTVCIADDCEDIMASKRGYCGSHLYKLRIYGDINYVRPPRPPRKDSHPLYHTWTGMRHRCSCVTSPSYPLYGGRGIYVCDRWNNLENGFENFLEDMGERPEGTSIDRIDNDGPYAPDNCRWALPVVQNNNKSTNLPIEFDGEIKTLAEWGREYDINPSIVYGRMYRLGWTIEEALNTPVHVKGEPKKRHKAIDKSKSVV